MSVRIVTEKAEVDQTIKLLGLFAELAAVRQHSRQSSEAICTQTFETSIEWGFMFYTPPPKEKTAFAFFDKRAFPTLDSAIYQVARNSHLAGIPATVEGGSITSDN